MPQLLMFPAGKIVTWLKNVGDKVSKGEPIVVVESDKVSNSRKYYSDKQQPDCSELLHESHEPYSQ